MERKQQTPNHIDETGKQRYHSPQFQVFGDITELTLASATISDTNDGATNGYSATS